MNDQQNNQQNNEITFLDVVSILVEYKRVTMVVFPLVVLIGVVISIVSEPIYRGEVVAAAAEKGSSAGSAASSMLSRLGGVAGLGGLSRLAQRDRVSQAIATLESQKFTREFIVEKNLLPVLFASKWDAENEKWLVDSPEDVPRLSDGFDSFDKIRSVKEDDETGLILLSVEWTDPELAAAWANDLIWRLNESLRADAITEANETIDFLNKEVEKTRIVQLQQAIYFMLEEQINIRTMANIRQEFAFKVISPAIAPELDRYVRPNRLLIVALSVFIGLFLGAFLSCIFHGIKLVREQLE